MKYYLLLISGATLAFTACSTNNTAEQAKAKVDSIANAKLAFIQAQQQHNNDSIIDAMAAARADSMMHTQSAVAPTVRK